MAGIGRALSCECPPLSLGGRILCFGIWGALWLLGGIVGHGEAQLGGFGCPMKGSPPIRQGDSVAASGGRFNSSRGADKKHGALDLNGKVGDAVFAALDGRVAVAQAPWGPMGNTIIIDHGEGAYTVYGHLQSITPKEGDRVKKKRRDRPSKGRTTTPSWNPRRWK